MGNICSQSTVSQDEASNRLWDAARNGDLNQAQHWLRNGADVTIEKNAHGVRGTPLSLARAGFERFRHTTQTARQQVFQQLIQIIQEALNEEVLKTIKAGDVNRLNTLSKSGADLHTAWRPSLMGHCLGVIEVAIETEGDHVEVVNALLQLDPRNEMVLTHLAKNNSSVVKLAEDNINQQVAALLRKKLGIIFVNNAKDVVNQHSVIDSTFERLRNRELAIHVDTTDEGGNTALMFAVQTRKLYLVTKLLALGANPEFKNKEGLTPIQASHMLDPRDPKIEKSLKTAKQSSVLSDSIVKTKSHLTLSEVTEIFKSNAYVQVNYCDSENYTPLLLAVKFKCEPEIVRYLIQAHDADVTHTNNAGYGPLEMAIENNSLDILDVLFEKKQTNFKTKFKNPNGGTLTLLQFAKDHGSEDVYSRVQTEINKCLWQSVQNSEYTRVKELFDLGAQVNFFKQSDETRSPDDKEGDSDGWTPLHLAANKGDIDMVSLLTNLGAAPDVLDSRNMSPLSEACHNGNLECVKKLRENGADLNDESCPLVHAVGGNSLDVVKYLVFWGADEDKETPDGKGALDGIAGSETSIAEFLKSLKPEHDYHKKKGHEMPGVKEEKDYAPMAPAPNTQIQIVPIKLLASGTNRTGNLMGPKTFNEEMMASARKGNWDKVEEAIQNGADIRYLENQKNIYEHVKELYDSHTHKSLQVKVGDKLFHRQMAERLNACAINIHQRAYGILARKVTEGDLGWVQSLHRMGTQIYHSTPQDPLGLVGSLCRSQHDSPDLLNYLIENHPISWQILTVRDQAGYNALGIARSKKHGRMTEYIISRLTLALQEKVASNDLQQVKFLLDAGAVPDIEGSNFPTLARAVENNNKDIVSALLLAHADSTWQYNDGKSITQRAIEMKFSTVTKLLQTASTNQHLLVATRAERIQDIIALHRQGADINIQNYHGDTPVSIAVRMGSAEVVHYFLTRGAAMSRNRPGTLVGDSKSLNNVHITEYLKDVGKERYADFLLNGDIGELEAIFAMPGFEPDVVDLEGGEIPATIAAKRHGLEMVKFLHERGIDVSSESDNGEYPLCIAAEQGDFPLVLYLVRECGVNKMVTNKQGKTAMQLAIDAGYKAVADYLQTGKIPDTQEEKEAQPMRSTRELVEAVHKSRMSVIDEFIKEKYNSRQLKIKCCSIMVNAAKQYRAVEIERKLSKHLKELEEDTSDNVLRGSKAMQRVLNSFVDSLVKVVFGKDSINDVTEAQVIEDNENKRQIISQIEGSLNTEKAMETLKDDFKRIDGNLTELRSNMTGCDIHVQEIYQGIEALNAKLKTSESPAERIKMRREREDLKTQLGSITLLERISNTKIALCERQQRALRYFETDAHRVKFYQIVYNKLYLYFSRCRARFLGHNVGPSKVEMFETKFAVADPDDGDNDEDVGEITYTLLKDFLLMIRNDILQSDATAVSQPTLEKLFIQSKLDDMITRTAIQLTVCFDQQINAKDGKLKKFIFARIECYEAIADVCLSRIILSFKKNYFVRPSVKPLELQMVQSAIVMESMDANYEGLKDADRLGQKKMTKEDDRIDISFADFISKAGVVGKDGSCFHSEKGSDIKMVGYLMVSEDIVKLKKKIWKDPTEVKEGKKISKNYASVEILSEAEEGNALLVQASVTKFLQEQGLTKDAVENGYKAAETSARDMFLDIQEKVNTVANDVNEKADVMMTDVNHHRQETSSTIGQHQKTTKRVLDDFRRDNRSFREDIVNQFEGYKSEMDSKMSRHLQDTHKTLDIFKKEQEKFNEKMEQGFDQHKKETEQLCENHKQYLNKQHTDALQELKARNAKYHEDNERRFQELTVKIRLDFEQLQTDLKKKLNEDTKAVENKLTKQAQDVETRVSNMAKKQEEFIRNSEKTMKNQTDSVTKTGQKQATLNKEIKTSVDKTKADLSKDISEKHQATQQTISKLQSKLMQLEERFERSKANT